MPIQRFGGFAAATCAATYLAGFALLAVYLAPLGYGTTTIDAEAVVAFIAANPTVMLAFNTIIYVVNALALTVLVTGLRDRLAEQQTGLADLTMALGMMWAALVLGAGMLGNVATEQAAFLYASDPAAAAERWRLLHTVELGLGGGNEIAGGTWILAVSLVSAHAKALPGIIWGLGILVGLCGLATIVPAAGEITGAVFGLGAIIWFFGVAWPLIVERRNDQPAIA